MCLLRRSSEDSKPLLQQSDQQFRVFFIQCFDNSTEGVCLVYTMLNNQEQSKFDLYLPGKLVASLHYKIDDEDNEVMFVYCEAIEDTDKDAHCQEIMKRALEDARGRWLKVNVTCPIALKYMEQNAAEN